MKKLLSIAFALLWISLQSFVADGQVIKFNKTYGDMAYNYGQRIIQAKDKGYFILGNESGDIGNTNIHVIRTDSMGVIRFEKVIGDASLYWANDFKRTSDRGFLITGFTNKNLDKGYDVLLIKTDSNANVEWERTYGGNDWDIGNAVVETKDDAYLLVGKTYSYGAANENIYAIKTNFSGDTIWTKTFGGDSTDYANAVDVMMDSTYLIGATTNSFGHGNFDGYVLNLNTNGDTIWTQTYGEDKEDIINSIKQTPDSGFVFVGSTMSYNAIQHENWLMRYDKNKNYMWKFPESWDIGAGDDVAYSVTVDDSSRFIITGYTTGAGNGGKELSVLVMGDIHSFKCSMTNGSAKDDEGNYAVQTTDQGYVVIGSSEGMGLGLSNIYMLKIAHNCSYSPSTQHVTAVNEAVSTEKNDAFTVSPTISNGHYTITFTDKNSLQDRDVAVNISDIYGRMVLASNLHHADNASYFIDISDKADGIYFINVSGKTYMHSFKVLKCGK